MTSVPAPPVPEVDGTATPSAEPRHDRRARHGRRARLYAWAWLLVALLVVLTVLTAANTRSVELHWVVGSGRASLVWIILVSALLGWLGGMTTSIAFHRRTRRRS